MTYRHDLWEIAASHHGVVRVSEAEDAGVPGVEVRKLAARGALTPHGQGVYVHRGVPVDAWTQLTVAVALVGEGAFLQREAVLDALDLGQVNPRKISVGTHRRVRRLLPDWITVELRHDLDPEDITQIVGISSTSVYQAIADVHAHLPPDRWEMLIDQAHNRDLLDSDEIAALSQTGLRGKARVPTS